MVPLDENKVSTTPMHGCTQTSMLHFSLTMKKCDLNKKKTLLLLRPTYPHVV